MNITITGKSDINNLVIPFGGVPDGYKMASWSTCTGIAGVRSGVTAFGVDKIYVWHSAIEGTKSFLNIVIIYLKDRSQ